MQSEQLLGRGVRFTMGPVFPWAKSIHAVMQSIPSGLWGVFWRAAGCGASVQRLACARELAMMDGDG